MKVNDITDKVINAAIDVHKTLGPGLLESLYEEALCYELEQRELNFLTQQTLPVPYKEIVLKGKFRLDLVVEDKVIVELKNVTAILPIHEAQILTYMKITEKKVGLILNFNAPLMKDGIKRMIL